MPLNFIGVIFRLYRPVIRRRVLPLRDLPAAAPQYAVRIALSQSVAYGSDEGLASFVDGWLVFQGQGCAFSFQASDVKPAGSDAILTFDGPCRPHRLAFEHTEKGFKKGWEAWRLRSNPPLGDATTVFPPVLPLSRRKSWNHPLTAVLLGIVLAGMVVWGLAAWPFILLACLLVTVANSFGRRSSRLALDRIAQGKPPRRSARTILGANIHLERLGEAFRADQRRRRRRRALVRRTISE